VHGAVAAMNTDHRGVTVQTRGNALDDRIAATLSSILGNGTSIDAEATGANGSTGDQAVTRA
jgi:hypothetical protein